MVLLSKRALKVLVSTMELAGSSENASSVMTRDFCAARQSLLAPRRSSSSRLGRRTQRSNTEQPGESVREMRLVAAIRYLREKCLSLGQAARLAGMNRLDFLDALATRGVPVFDLSAQDAATEITAAQRVVDS